MDEISINFASGNFRKVIANEEFKLYFQNSGIFETQSSLQEKYR